MTIMKKKPPGRVSAAQMLQERAALEGFTVRAARLLVP
jgi:hypothetical protein